MSSPSPLPAVFEQHVAKFLAEAAVMPVDGDLELLIMEAHRLMGPMLVQMAVSTREQANATKEAAFSPSGMPSL